MVFLQIFAPILLMLYLLFGGYFVTLDSVVVWLKWIKVLSPFKYGFAGVYLCASFLNLVNVLRLYTE